MSAPLAIDLFCKAGGAAMGLHRAGFDVVGVDIRPQPNYPFEFVQGDALTLDPAWLARADLLWASPPCQRYSRVWRGREAERERYPDLVDATRRLLRASGVRLTCIENVPGAPLRPDLVLTGAMFDLDLIRDRIFELAGFRCPFRLAPQHAGTVSDGDLACVAGHGANNAWATRRRRLGLGGKWRDLPADLRRRLLDRNSKAGWSTAMGIDWMTRDELREAVPPAYAEFIGRAAMEAVRAGAARDVETVAILEHWGVVRGSEGRTAR